MGDDRARSSKTRGRLHILGCTRKFPKFMNGKLKFCRNVYLYVSLPALNTRMHIAYCKGKKIIIISLFNIIGLHMQMFSIRMIFFLFSALIVIACFNIHILCSTDSINGFQSFSLPQQT